MGKNTRQALEYSKTTCLEHSTGKLNWWQLIFYEEKQGYTKTGTRRKKNTTSTYFPPQKILVVMTKLERLCET